MNDQALNMNPELMLSNIKTYFTMLDNRTSSYEIESSCQEVEGARWWSFRETEGLSTDEAKAAFKKFDRDGDGVVTMAEVERFARKPRKMLQLMARRKLPNSPVLV